jgi:hypothetical protein
LALLALAACSGDRVGTLFGTTAPPEAPAAAPVNMAGLWLLGSPGHGQCRMTFGAAAPNATEGTIAPQGGCPGKFYMSRKWTAEQAGIVVRDHNGQPLAQLTAAGAGFEGKATGGEPITLMR